MSPRLLIVFTALTSGCGAELVQTLTATPIEMSTSAAMTPCSALPSFADERGGGLFIDLAGRVLRLRADGTRAALESHPQNETPPGPALSLWPLGPYTALVVTTQGFFISDEGWLIAPSWQSKLSIEGFVMSTLGTDGIAWLAHRDGLFRIVNGELQELKAAGQPITGITALAVAPADDLRPGVWFAQSTSVSVAAQLDPTHYSIRDSGLTASDLVGGIRGLAAIAPAPGSPGAVWVVTSKAIYERTLVAWRRTELARIPKQVASAGRFVWIQAGDTLYQFDGDERSWRSASGLQAVPRILAMDATGAAWSRVAEQTLLLSPTLPPRLLGLFSGQTVSSAEAQLELLVAAGATLESATWRFDDRVPEPIDLTTGRAYKTQTAHSLGGVDLSGRPRPVSFGSLEDGQHTLEVVTRAGGVDSLRRLHFTLSAATGVEVSWFRDLKPLTETRCNKCHNTGAMPEISSYELWKMNAPAIAAAVRDRRMPADGPLDTPSMQLVQRWIAGGMLP